MKPLPWFQPFLETPKDVLTVPKLGKVSLATMLSVLACFIIGGYVGYWLAGFLGGAVGAIGCMLGMIRLIFLLEADAEDTINGWLSYHLIRLIKPSRLEFRPDTRPHDVHGNVIILGKNRQARSIIERRK